MVGNMFCNTEAISLIWEPSPPKLLSTISGALVNNFLLVIGFLMDETTSRARE